VIYTADNTTTGARLATGATVWHVIHPDVFGLQVAFGAPTLTSGPVDVSTYTAAGDGSVMFNPADGTFTESPPAIHQLRGQLVVDGTQSAIVNGSYGSGVGPLYVLNFGGRGWWVNFGPIAIGTPLISAGRAWLGVGGSLAMYDPAGPCNLLPIPNPPPYCLPTAMLATDTNPLRPSYGGPGRIAIASSGASSSVREYSVTGQLVWTFTDGSTILGATAWSNNTIYVGGADGTLRALDASTGALRWTGAAGAPIRSAPTIANGKVYVATDGGRLVTFPSRGCGAGTCGALAVGDVHKTGALASGPPLVRNGIAVVAFGNEVVAFAAG
jgi:outer membrane protein assembly factor BamB